MIHATYYDTRSSRAHAVVLSVAAGEAILRDADGVELRRAPLGTLRVSERGRRAPRLVTFADGAYCEITDHATFDALLSSTGHREGWVVRAQNSWRLALLSVLGLLVFLVLSYYVLLPWGAAVMARSVPPELEATLGRATLDSLDRGIVQPSTLAAAEQQRIRDNFAALRLPGHRDHAYRILFRHGARLGANALALPGGTIVVTDELVALIGTGAGMMGVLAHEAGHVAERHGLQQIIQASAVGAFAAYVFGDFSTVLAGVPAAVLTLRYSRDHEREADAYAVEAMRRSHLPVSALADVLQKLDASSRRGAGTGEKAGRADAEDDSEGFFSTHPLTRDRIDAIRAAGG